MSKNIVAQPETAFAQAAVAALERIALHVIRCVPCRTQRRLFGALHEVRRTLKLPPPRHPLVALRDWPGDPAAGEALQLLLARLDEMRRGGK
jgi:hypothetical protein